MKRVDKEKASLPLAATALNARKIETFLRLGAVEEGRLVACRALAERWPSAVIGVFFAGRRDLY